MKKVNLKVIVILGIIVLIVSIFAVKNFLNRNKTIRLQITSSSWSGETEDYKPEEKKSEYEIVLRREYSVDGLVFTIDEINSNSIIISTVRSYSDSEKGIDLTTKKTEFTVYLNKELKLKTPTMDSGNIYTLKLIK